MATRDRPRWRAHAVAAWRVRRATAPRHLGLAPDGNSRLSGAAAERDPRWRVPFPTGPRDHTPPRSGLAALPQRPAVSGAGDRAALQIRPFRGGGEPTGLRGCAATARRDAARLAARRPLAERSAPSLARYAPVGGRQFEVRRLKF